MNDILHIPTPSNAFGAVRCTNNATSINMTIQTDKTPVAVKIDIPDLPIHSITG